jgi:hypothetical protein
LAHLVFVYKEPVIEQNYKMTVIDKGVEAVPPHLSSSGPGMGIPQLAPLLLSEQDSLIYLIW